MGLAKRLISWRIYILEDRIEALREYVHYREELDGRLRRERRVRDWLVKTCLWVRRLVNRIVLGAWLRLLEIRKQFWKRLDQLWTK